MSLTNFYGKWVKCCRMCCSDNNNVPIFEEDPLTDVCLQVKILECTLIKVEYGDGLPSNICVDCHKNINKWYTYKQECHKIDILLHQQLLLIQQEQEKQILQKEQEKQLLRMNVFPAPSFLFPVYNFINNTSTSILNINQMATNSPFESKYSTEPTQECSKYMKQDNVNQPQVFNDENNKFPRNIRAVVRPRKSHQHHQNMSNEFTHSNNNNVENVHNDKNKESYNKYFVLKEIHSNNDKSNDFYLSQIDDLVKNMYNGNFNNVTCEQVNNDITFVPKASYPHQNNILPSVQSLSGDILNNNGMSENLHHDNDKQVYCNNSNIQDSSCDQNKTSLQADDNIQHNNDTSENICHQLPESVNQLQDAIVQESILPSVSTNVMQTDDCSVRNNNHCKVRKPKQVMCNNTTIIENDICHQKMILSVHTDGIHNKVDSTPQVINENVTEKLEPGKFKEGSSETSIVQNVGCHQNENIFSSIHTNNILIGNDILEENNICYKISQNSDYKNLEHVSIAENKMVLCTNDADNIHNLNNRSISVNSVNDSNVSNIKGGSSDLLTKVLKNHCKTTIETNRDPDVENYSCSHCNKNFIGKVNFQQHICTHSGGMALGCLLCEVNTPIEEEANEVSQNGGESAIVVKKRKYSRKGNTVNCSLCNHWFCSQASLKLHMKRCHYVRKSSLQQDEPVKCLLCNKWFPSKGKLKSHITRYCVKEEELLPCHLCTKHFSTKHCLEKHISRTHRREKTLLCDQCPAKFKHNQALKVHRQNHCPERLFLCNICGESFKSDSCLKSHINYKHTLKKIYECDICKKICKTRTCMIIHSQTHNLHKPYFCPNCYKSFKCKSYIRNHECDRSSLETVSCPICRKEYKRIYLKQHMRYHTESIVCLACCQSFGNSSKLKRHMRTKTHKKTEMLSNVTDNIESEIYMKIIDNLCQS